MAGLSVADLKKTLRTLTQLHAESRLDTLKSLLAEVDSLNEDRNNVIHGCWFLSISLADREGRSDVAFRPRRWKSELQGKLYTVTDLNNLTERYRRLTERFDEWVAKWPEEGSPSTG